MAIASPRPGRLPEPTSALIGREQDLEITKRLLGSHRLVTLTGTGGSGKTRLAVEVASELRDDYADGAVFVRLQDARGRPAVAATIAADLGIREWLDVDREESIATYLIEREMLLVLDNFEQVLAAASLVSTMLEAAPSIRVLVTSRAPLRISGEQEYEVLPLADDAAFALFVERARTVHTDFDPGEHEAAIAGVARRVDGLPLAVELAAAQTRLLTPAQILERLDRRLPVLSVGQRDAPARQRTQRATLDWSYELLDGPGQHLFARLSVFAGGWTMAAAERVCELIEGEAVDVFDGLTTLVESSLVRVRASDGAEPRYSMLQVTREYAADRLDELPERDAIGRAHAEWVRDLVETAEPELLLQDLRRSQEQLRAELENIRTALRWAIDRSDRVLGQRIAGSLWRSWHHWGEFQEGIAWLESVLELPDVKTPSEPRTRAMSALAAILWHQGRGPESLSIYLEVIELRRALGDDERLRDAIGDASWAAFLSGDVDLAMSLIEEKWRYPPRPHTSSLDGWMDHDAEVAVCEVSWRNHGSYEKAITLMEAILDDVRRSDQALFAAHMTLNAATVHLQGGRTDLALRRGRESLRLYIELGHVGQLVVTLEFVALCELAVGHAERAVRLAAASDRRGAKLGGTVGSYGGPLSRQRGVLGKARSQLSAERYARAIAEGRAMSLDEAVAFALSKATHRPSTRASGRRDPDALTARELEVLDLLSEGRTDTEIGEALFISPKTASAHVSNIKGKLGAGSRAEIVAIALRGDSATAES